VFGGVPERPRNNKGNDQYYEDDAYNHQYADLCYMRKLNCIYNSKALGLSRKS
jgi:hypothetical protein